MNDILWAGAALAIWIGLGVGVVHIYQDDQVVKARMLRCELAGGFMVNRTDCLPDNRITLDQRR